MSLSSPNKAAQTRFVLDGTVAPLAKGAEGYRPRRELGGWLATYGKRLEDGSIVPTVDREGHNFESARTVGGIDFSGYLDLAKGTRGLWNDTHHFNAPAGQKVYVGVPTALEHHDGETDLSKAHGKVGWWTEGHLFDREDPRSWTDFTSYVPTPLDLDRADYYWRAASLLKGVPRDLGLSAEGKMLLSPCGHRILWAAVTECAVCELPQNPDATVHPLRLAVPLTRGMLDADPCETCACPPNLRCPPLAKAVTTGTTAAITPEDLEGAPRGGNGAATGKSARDERDEQLVERLVQQLVARNPSMPDIERKARAWARALLAQQRKEAAQRRQNQRSSHD